MTSIDPEKPRGVIRELQSQGIEIDDNSMLKSFINCPRMFEYGHILGLTPVSSRPAPALEFGLAIHLALENWYQGKDDGRAIKSFVESFTPHEEPPKIGRTGKELSATYTVLYGCSILTEYFRRYRNDTREIIMLETPIAEELAEGVFLAGRVDKIVKSSRGYVFVDYKSTKYMNDFLINPNSQFMTYKFLSEKLTGEKVTGELDIIGVSKSKGVGELLRREPFDYTDYQMQEWKKSVIQIVKNIGRCKEQGFFPQTWNCKPFFRDCAYMPLCTLPVEETREKLVENLYRVEFWDPFKG